MHPLLQRLKNRDFEIFLKVNQSQRIKLTKVKSNNIQLYWLEMASLLNKPYENEVILKGHHIPLRYCQHLDILTEFTKGVDFFNAKNLGSVGVG